MNVLSLCDGMACAHIALTELGIKVDNYYASEIDKNSIKVAMDNYPKIQQLGDVISLSTNEEMLATLPKIDLVCFGFPCRSASKNTFGNKGYHKGLKGISGLFYNCNAVLDWVKKNNNPQVKFFIENVDTDKKADWQEISRLVGVDFVMVDSADFSPQHRRRCYWTNLDFTQALDSKKDKRVIKDVLDAEVEDKYFDKREFVIDRPDKSECGTVTGINGHDILKRVYNINFKSPTITSCRGGNTQKKIYIDGKVRKLTPSEYRKLQGIPEWYKTNVADSHIYNMCGDGWQIDTIKEFFKNLKHMG